MHVLLSQMPPGKSGISASVPGDFQGPGVRRSDGLPACHACYIAVIMRLSTKKSLGRQTSEPFETSRNLGANGPVMYPLVAPVLTCYLLHRSDHEALKGEESEPPHERTARDILTIWARTDP